MKKAKKIDYSTIDIVRDTKHPERIRVNLISEVNGTIERFDLSTNGAMFMARSLITILFDKFEDILDNDKKGD